MEIHWNELSGVQTALEEMGASGRTSALLEAGKRWSASNRASQPATLGREGEQRVLAELRRAFHVENCSKSPHSGDMRIQFEGSAVMVEVKNWQTTVAKREIDKFFRDVDMSRADCGLMVSLESGFARYGNFWLGKSEEGRPVMLLSCGHPEVVSACVKMLCAELTMPVPLSERYLQDALAAASRLTQLERALCETEAGLAHARGFLKQTQKELDRSLMALAGEGEAVASLEAAVARFPSSRLAEARRLLGVLAGCSVRVSPCAIHLRGTNQLRATLTPSDSELLIAVSKGSLSFTLTIRSSSAGIDSDDETRAVSLFDLLG